MKDFLLLMHADTERAVDASAWDGYFGRLRALERFQGGSALGGGLCLRQSGTPARLHDDVTGYIRVLAIDLDDARSLVEGNPVFLAGGTVEIRELPRS